MGYSYGVGPSGRWVLSCDECGRADGTVRKVRCPWGYCPSAALCYRCRGPDSPGLARWGGRWASKDVHRRFGCEAGHLAFEAERARERELAAAGEYMRRSAMTTDATDPETGEPLTQVVFQRSAFGETGPELWRVMRQSTYRAVPLGTIALESDYLKHGPVVAGPVGYAHTPESAALVGAAWLFVRGRGRSLGGSSAPATPIPAPAAAPGVSA